MRLSELLDKESITSISSKTMISVDNVEKIISEDYSGLTKAKTLGFLSILEREYGIDLKDVRHNAMSYFEINHDKNDSINIALPKVEEKHGRSRWSLLIILALLGYASWYFFTQFDQKRLNELLPISTTDIADTSIEKNESIWSINTSKNEQNEEKKAIESVVVPVVSKTSVSKVLEKKNELSVRNYTIKEETSIPTQRSALLKENDNKKLTVSKSEEENIVKQTKIEETAVTITQAVLNPVKRLWFGLINIETGKKDHFSIRKAYTIDLTKGEYLVTTSPAPFALEIKGEIYRYNNGRSHYFKITRSGLTPLSKNAYVRQGGYTKW